MKFSHLFALTIFVGIIFAAEAGNLPADIEKCKVSDHECMRKKIMEIFAKYPHGSPSFGMLDVSALTLKNVTFSEARRSSPIQLNFKFVEVTYKGLERTNIKHISGLNKDIKSAELEASIAKLVLSGKYETNGKILILSLDGHGHAEIIMYDTDIKVRLKCHLEERNGKNYIKIDKLKSTTEPKNMEIHLENLVENNPELTDAFNKVINENWMDVWNELKPGINKVFSTILANILEDIFNKLAYDDFFAE